MLQPPSIPTYNKPHSIWDIAKAVLKFTPRLPQFLWCNLTLARSNPSTQGSPGYFFQQQAQLQPEAPFLRYENTCYTYGVFNAWVNQLAHTLKQQGIGKGDCVGVMLENRPELIALVLAVNKTGAIAGMLNHKQRERTLAHSLDLIQPKLMLVGSECLDAYQTAKSYVQDWNMQDVPTFSLPDASSTEQAASVYGNFLQLSAQQSTENPTEAQQLRLGDVCYYVFTSGTTGLPKAAPMTNLRWFKAGLGFGRMSMHLTAKDTLYCCLPFYHNTALAIGLSCVVNTGACLALARQFSASGFWQDIQHFQATSFVYIGEVCRYLLNRVQQAAEQEHQVRVVVGNGLRPELWDAFEQRFGITRICELYGASEGNIGFVNVFNLKRTVGFSPMKYRIIRFDVNTEQPVLGPNGHMQRVKKGEVGLLLSEVSRKAPFDGYTKSEANESKLLRNVFKPGDCWFNTGDLVRDQGYRHVAFIDRVGDTFRWKSENVATTEVEAELHTFAPIAEAVVYGVKVPYTEGRAGMASLVMEQGRSFDVQSFYQHIKDKLPDYAVPVFVRLRQQHETTTTFKVKKAKLKQEGFLPSCSNEPIFVLVSRQLGYQPLDEQLLADIQAGRMRF
ncbi:long-chain-acyl-CoA synthetase [Aliidiomarina taiwanensis]|uniref:Long-chain-acyl-CoA synthetase n=1 Tax=Aliidiomarina taiwanensis TaxID=946228 RepID=A0A432XA24_9GAMM|nr:long-chain-acyl-CoA synthetase [Aliidiomarina taiwanensis]RUO44265.1 long-chain-acyl-CoA synthetase [Aliidiomarina taiwanensis]